MMRWYVLTGLIIGGVVAIGQLSAAQLVAIAGTVQLWIAWHWYVLVPWILTILFARLWWRAELRGQALEELAGKAIATAARTHALVANGMRRRPQHTMKARNR